MLREPPLELRAVQRFVVESGCPRRVAGGDERGRAARPDDESANEAQQALPGRALQRPPELQRLEREGGEPGLALALYGEPPGLPGERAPVVPDGEPFVAVDRLAAQRQPPCGHRPDRAEADHGDIGVGVGVACAVEEGRSLVR
jgi:hypothetical protein